MKKPPKAICDEECPERGPALTHAHSANCPDGHVANRCCHCGVLFIHLKDCRHQGDGEDREDVELVADDMTLPRAVKPDDGKNPWLLIGMTPQQELELLKRTMAPRKFERLRFLQWLYQAKDQLK